MSEKLIRRPQMKMIALEDLSARPEMASRLSPRQRKALKTRLTETARYPALVVRPHPKRRNKYEIIDGHARAKLLAELGFKSARCELWPADNGEAAFLAVSLNQLRGRPDARARGRVLRKLTRKFGCDETADRLGITVASLRRFIQQADPPKLKASGTCLELQPVVFHLPAEQVERLDRALEHFGSGRSRRSDALIKALQAGLAVKGKKGS